MYVRMYVCMSMSMYVCVCTYVCTYVCTRAMVMVNILFPVTEVHLTYLSKQCPNKSINLNAIILTSLCTLKRTEAF